jgi:serine/threonine-protein kinase
MTLFGTPEYMAPEQVAGGRLDHRADVYALGCVLYEMLTGSLPFEADSSVAVIDAKLRGSPDTVRERAPVAAVPRPVDRLVMKTLARHPSRRFDSALALAEALEAVLQEPTRQRARRRAVGGALVAASMSFATVMLGFQARPWLDRLPEHMPWLRNAPAQTGELQEPSPDADTPTDADAQPLRTPEPRLDAPDEQQAGPAADEPMAPAKVTQRLELPAVVVAEPRR